jgi:hypothetical protein
MENKEWKIQIDWELERQVMIFVSNEAPEGLFELPSEFGQYDLTFPQRMELTYSILIELLNEGLVTLEEYSSREARTPTREIEKEKTKVILNNHYNWYPVGQPFYSIGTTEKGIEYLNSLSDNKKKKLNDRLFGEK